MALTSTERASFTAEKLVEWDRMADGGNKFLVMDTSDYKRNEGESAQAFTARKTKDSKAFRAKQHGKLANMSANGLRVRINIDGFKNAAPVFSSDDNFTTDEKAVISNGYKGNVGRSFTTEIPYLLEWDVEMKAASVSDNMRKYFMMAR